VKRLNKKLAIHLKVIYPGTKEKKEFKYQLKKLELKLASPIKDKLLGTKESRNIIVKKNIGKQEENNRDNATGEKKHGEAVSLTRDSSAGQGSNPDFFAILPGGCHRSSAATKTTIFLKV
jgi:hypothetical protein